MMHVSFPPFRSQYLFPRHQQLRSKQHETQLNSFPPPSRAHFPTFVTAIPQEDFAAPLRVWEGDFSVVAAPNTTSRGIGSGWPAAISSLAWSEHRPAVFFVLDSSGAMHAFDVLEDDGGPIASEPCPPAAAATIAAARGPSSASLKTRPEANQAASPLPPPALALSSETLATGSRPKVALAFRGCVFTRNLAGRVFRRRQSPPVMTGLGGPAKDCSEAGSTSERERMKAWLGQVLW